MMGGDGGGMFIYLQQFGSGRDSLQIFSAFEVLLLLNLKGGIMSLFVWFKWDKTHRQLFMQVILLAFVLLCFSDSSGVWSK